MRLGALALFSLLSVATLSSCAVASEEVDGAPGRKVRDGGGSSDSGEDEDTGSEEEADSGSASVDSGSSSTDSGSSSTDSGSSSTDTGSGTKDTGTPPADTGGGTPCSTLGTAECNAATSLGSVSGDTGSTTKTTSGNDSQFVRVTVTEDDSSLFTSKDPKVKITLASTGGNFDLYVYLGPTKGDGGGVECSTVKNSSTNPASDDVLSISWGDNRPIGGHDDARVVTIEVRATMPVCSGASWTLTVEGNK